MAHVDRDTATKQYLDYLTEELGKAVATVIPLPLRQVKPVKHKEKSAKSSGVSR